MKNQFTGLAFTCLLASLLSWMAPAQAQTNLLTNGSFELDPVGKVFPNASTSSNWRWFAVGDARGTATVRTAAATDGTVGLELVRTATGAAAGSDSGLDKWNNPETIPAEQRVYKFLMDAKDGGIYGGSTYSYLQLQFPSPAASPYFAFDPSANFETFGILGTSGKDGTLSARATTSPDASSILLDNCRVYDVTDGNRVLNGGFENSDSRLINWRVVSVNPGEFDATLSNDAHSGTHAALIQRLVVQSGDADGTLDLDNDRIPTIPGELLTIDFAAKKHGGDEATRLAVIIAEFDATGTFTGQKVLFYKPYDTAYSIYSTQLRVAATTAQMVVSFRVGNSTDSVRYLGSYLLDDVSIKRGTDSNVLDNGSFENQAEGDANAAINAWRVPFTDTVGTVTVRSAAASVGDYGIELMHATNGTFFLDRWETTVPPVSKPGVYKLLVDAKDGGTFGGQDTFDFRGVIHGPPYLEYATICEPGTDFETFGLTIPAAADANGIDVRLTPSATANQSFYADNLRVMDVTRANRVVNGGFENSASRLVNWRTYNLGASPSEFTSALSADAHSGSHALRIERTVGGDTASDGAVDLFDGKLFVIPGESLEVGAWVKKVSGDADARLGMIVTEWNASGALNGTLAIPLINAGDTYQRYTVQVTPGTEAAMLNVAFVVISEGGPRHIGAYLIDDVSVIQNGPPTFGNAVLSYNYDDSIALVTSSGWSDPDGDPEQYLYQWKLNGVAIAGATSATLPRSQISGNGTVTCTVTAYDGLTSGTTLEASFPPTLATSIEAGQTETPLTIDGSAADWENLPSRVLPMSVYGQGDEDMLVNIRFAWDTDYLYFLIEEVQDDNQNEAANQSDYRDQAWMFDSISFWISFRNNATLLNGAFNPWFGFSSSGRSDLFTARLNNGATYDETAFEHGSVMTGGSFAAHNRVIEARLTWADMAAVTNDDLEPYGGLLAAVGEEYRFGCEPLLIDNGYPGQSFRTGQAAVYPTGDDADSVDVRLVGPDYSLNAVTHWAMFE